MARRSRRRTRRTDSAAGQKAPEPQAKATTPAAAPPSRTTPAATKPSMTKPAMTTPAIDAFCIGGGSILLVLALLAFDVRVPAEMTFGMVATNFLINAPHFMATYVLLYAVADRRQEYKRVSVFMPLALLAWMIFALARYQTTPAILEAMFGSASVLLAWHYTGQTYGMMASFGFLDGRGFTTLERRLVRANLYVLLAWHVIWALVVVRKMFSAQNGASALVPWSDATLQTWFQAVGVVAGLSSLLGLAGLVLLWRRTGRPPTMRTWIPWVAVHFWYVLMYREPAAIFWVQNAHALQYLIFPMRVQMNRASRAGASGSSRGLLLKFYAVIFLLGILILGIVPDGFRFGFESLGLGTFPILTAVAAFVNIHHYFIDNAIWKIRNRTVREDLFAHLQPAAAAR